MLHVTAGLDPRGIQRGNYLPSSASAGLNFLSPEIAQFVDGWLERGRQPGSLVDEDRLRRNMLSSMPLAFNLFVPLQADLALASAVFSQLTAGRVNEVTEIIWEFSPGRRDPAFTGDRTAFDVFISFRSPSAASGFIGIEVKYHENLRGDRAARVSRYVDIAEQMGCFHRTALSNLHDPPLGQLWRNHLLAGSLQNRGPFTDSLSAVIYPGINMACRKAARMYRACLADASSFATWELEDVAQAIAHNAPSPWIEAFAARYLDLEPVS